MVRSIRQKKLTQLATTVHAPLKSEYVAQARDMPLPAAQANHPYVPSVRPPSSDDGASDAQDARAKRKFPKVRARPTYPAVVQKHRRRCAQVGCHVVRSRDMTLPNGAGKARLRMAVCLPRYFVSAGHHVAVEHVLQLDCEAQLDFVRILRTRLGASG